VLTLAENEPPRLNSPSKGRIVRKLSVLPVTRAQQIKEEDLSASAVRRQGGTWRCGCMTKCSNMTTRVAWMGAAGLEGCDTHAHRLRGAARFFRQGGDGGAHGHGEDGCDDGPHQHRGRNQLRGEHAPIPKLLHVSHPLVAKGSPP
jgi:hypothetical protein